MATAAQFAANRANAQLSTGPRSAEGKSRSAQNALRHGLTAARPAVREDERAAFETLRDALLEELDPQGAVESVTFQELLHAAWNLHRFRALEACLDFADPADAAVLDRLARHQSRAQRAYYRALAELRTLQTNRALRAAKLDPETEPEVPAIADINEMTKQTRSEVTAEAIEQAIHMLELDSRLLVAGARGRIDAGTAAARAVPR